MRKNAVLMAIVVVAIVFALMAVALHVKAAPGAFDAASMPLEAAGAAEHNGNVKVTELSYSCTGKKCLLNVTIHYNIDPRALEQVWWDHPSVNDTLYKSDWVAVGVNFPEPRVQSEKTVSGEYIGVLTSGYVHHDDFGGPLSQDVDSGFEVDVFSSSGNWLTLPSNCTATFTFTPYLAVRFVGDDGWVRVDRYYLEGDEYLFTMNFPPGSTTPDSDGDGVTDGDDQCPGTPAGVAVDVKGCPVALDSDGDGVLDDIDQCPGTPAGIAVDDKGCPIGMQLSVSTDKKTYSPGETVIIRGSVWDAKGGLDGATVAIDVDGTKLTATTDSSGKYKCEFPLPPAVTQGTYTATATASYSGYPSASKSTSFVVGEIGMQREENAATGKPFIGVAADGVSSINISISLPGCSNVKASQPDIGKFKGDSASLTGGIQLNSDGQAELIYYPPDYLTKNQLTRNLDVHQSGSKIWAAEVPLVFTYKDASEQEGRIEGKILVCRPPVMLVHGFLGATATWSKMSSYLQGEKFDTYLGNYGATDQSIEGLSQVLKLDIRKQKLDYANSDIKMAKVDAVGHSMGGLIARYYAHDLPDYPGDLRKLIMVGTPNHGVSWIKKIIGNVAAGWYQTHRIPAQQLYSESSFMKKLNSGERTGAHLNPDVQYGNIYGLPDDWVVSAASAYLNGVNYLLESDVKHSSDILGVPAVAITEYLKTWEQVKSWLTSDIYRLPLKGSHAEVYKYWGDVYHVLYDASGCHENKLESCPTTIDSFQTLRTGKDSKAIVHLMISDCTWGIIFLDQDSEIFLGYFSPQLVEIRLWKGSAAFRSRKDTHFTVPVNIERTEGGEWWKYSPQAVVTGLDTEFAITACNEIEVHCLEGKLVVETPNATEVEAILSANNSVAVKGESIVTINPTSEDDFWWSTEDDGYEWDTYGDEPYLYVEDMIMEKTVEIPIMMCNAEDLANMDLDWSYNASVLKLINVTKGSLNEKALFDWNEVNPGQLKIAFASAKGVTGSGAIAVMKFEVIGNTGDTSTLTGTVTTAGKTDGTEISVSVTPGEFRVGTSQIKGDCDGDGELTVKDVLAALQMSVVKLAIDMCCAYNKDGSVDSADARDMLKAIVGK